MIKRMSIIYKILIIFTLLILIMYGYFIYVLNIGKKDIEDKLSELTESKLSYVFANIENEILSVREEQTHIINDVKLFKIMYGTNTVSNYERIYTLDLLRDDVSQIGFSHDIIKDITLYISTVNRSISPTYINNIQTAQLLELYAAFKDKENDLLMIGDSLFVVDENPFQYEIIDNIQLPDAFVVSELSLKKIQDSYEKFFDPESDKYMLLLSDTGQIVTANMDESEIINTNSFIEQKKDFLPNAIIKETSDNSIFVYIQSSKLNISTILCLERDHYNIPLQKYSSLYFVVTIIVLLIIASFFFSIRVIVKKPINRMLQSFANIHEGNINATLDYRGGDEFNYLYQGFNDMLARIKELIHQVYEQKMRTQEANLKQLQYQVNPHFLYNCLFILYEIIKFGDEENAKKMTKSLISYYQYITNDGNEDKIVLSKEMEHVRNYLNLQYLRYGDRINFIADELPENIEALEVPRLIIQPIIENAYKHGMSNIEKEGVIRLSFKTDDEYVKINVDDNGEDIEDEKIQELNEKLRTSNFLSDGTGLINVHRRLYLMFGEKSGITLSRSKLGGLCVTISINISGVKNV